MKFLNETIINKRPPGSGQRILENYAHRIIKSWKAFVTMKLANRQLNAQQYNIPAAKIHNIEFVK